MEKLTGRVLKSTGSWYVVQFPDGKAMNCRTRGKLRLEGSKETNPVAVGDEVEVEPQTGIIANIRPRRNHIVRQSTRKTGHRHVLAANVDQAVLVVTLREPRTSLGFVDRFLVTCVAFDIPQVLVFNKRDLLEADELDICKEVMTMYERLGIKTLLLSAREDSDLTELVSILSGKTTLLAGHSGAGKSTLLNRLVPDANQVTAEISGYSSKGVHTTTFAEMFFMGADTWLVDTPGIKEWGLEDIQPADISGYFPEMRELRNECRFGGRCLHLEEPQCAVRAAVESGIISVSRYSNYVSMVLGEDNRK